MALLSFHRVPLETVVDAVCWYPWGVGTAIPPDTLGEQSLLSCRKWVTVTEADPSPWFSRTSCSFIASREEEEKIRKRSGGKAR